MNWNAFAAECLAFVYVYHKYLSLAPCMCLRSYVIFRLKKTYTLCARNCNLEFFGAELSFDSGSMLFHRPFCFFFCRIGFFFILFALTPAVRLSSSVAPQKCSCRTESTMCVSGPRLGKIKIRYLYMFTVSMLFFCIDIEAMMLHISSLMSSIFNDTSRYI